jgi:hypothetical protein
LTCCFFFDLFRCFYLTCNFAPFVQHVASFFLLDMLLHSACLTSYTLFALLDMLLRSFCLTCYSTLVARPVTLLFLLDLLCYSCSTYYFAPLAQPTPFLLLNLLHSFCSTCFIFLVRPLYSSTSMLCS